MGLTSFGSDVIFLISLMLYSKQKKNYLQSKFGYEVETKNVSLRFCIILARNLFICLIFCDIMKSLKSVFV